MDIQIFDTDFFILICACNPCEFVQSVALIVFHFFADFADIAEKFSVILRILREIASVGATLLIGSSLQDLSLCYIRFYHKYRPYGTFLEGGFLVLFEKSKFYLVVSTTTS